MDESAHSGEHLLAAARRGGVDRHRQRRRGSGHPVPSGGCADDPAKISLTGIYLGQAVIAVLAVIAVSGEYGTGMIRLTLTATPRRLTVLAAKAAIITGLILVAGAIAVLGSLLAGGNATVAERRFQQIGPMTRPAWPSRPPPA